MWLKSGSKRTSERQRNRFYIECQKEETKKISCTHSNDIVLVFHSSCSLFGVGLCEQCVEFRAFTATTTIEWLKIFGWKINDNLCKSTKTEWILGRIGQMYWFLGFSSEIVTCTFLHNWSNKPAQHTTNSAISSIAFVPAHSNVDMKTKRDWKMFECVCSVRNSKLCPWATILKFTHKRSIANRAQHTSTYNLIWFIRVCSIHFAWTAFIIHFICSSLHIAFFSVG